MFKYLLSQLSQWSTLSVLDKVLYYVPSNYQCKEPRYYGKVESDPTLIKILIVPEGPMHAFGGCPSDGTKVLRSSTE